MDLKKPLTARGIFVRNREQRRGREEKGGGGATGATKLWIGFFLACIVYRRTNTTENTNQNSEIYSIVNPSPQTFFCVTGNRLTEKKEDGVWEK